MRKLKTVRLDLFINFIACARSGNLTRAAVGAGLSRTALWQQLQALERTYRVDLFRRKQYGIELTPDGEQFLALVEPLVTGFQGLSAAFDARRRGLDAVLRLACPDSIEENELVPVLERFREANPGIRLEVVETQSRGVPGLVMSREVSLGIEVDPPAVGAGGLRYVRLFDRRVFVALREDHPLAAVRLTLAGLAAYPFAAEPVGSRLRLRVDRAFASAGLAESQRVVLESSSERVLLVATAKGRAVAVVSCRRAPPTPAGVRAVAAGHLFGKLPVYLVSRAGARGAIEADFELALLRGFRARP